MLPYAGLHGNFLRNTCFSGSLREVLRLRNYPVRHGVVVITENNYSRWGISNVQKHHIYTCQVQKDQRLFNAVLTYLDLNFG